MAKAAAARAVKFLLAIVIVHFVLTIALPTFCWKLVESLVVCPARYQQRKNAYADQEFLWKPHDAALLQREQPLRQLRGH